MHILRTWWVQCGRGPQSKAAELGRRRKRGGRLKRDLKQNWRPGRLPPTPDPMYSVCPTCPIITRGQWRYTPVSTRTMTWVRLDFDSFWVHNGLRIPSEIKSDVRFEFSDPKYLHSHVHIASKDPFGLQDHYSLETASEVKSEVI